MIFVFKKTDLRLALLVGLFLLGACLGGCQSNAPPDTYVARVGSHYLTQNELDRRLAGMGPVRDSTAARRQVIEQWVTRTLLYQEAQRLNLQSVKEIQQKLEQQRRSILITAVKNQFYEETDLAPSDEEVRTYFQRHKDQLVLREPYVRVRYLTTQDRAAAQTVRQELRTLPAQPDSAWNRLVREYAADTAWAREWSGRFVPQSELANQIPALRAELRELEPGDMAPILNAGDQYHVLRLDRRIPEGTVPELQWVESQIRRRLRIRARKQMYADEVERLRNKAKADGALETP